MKEVPNAELMGLVWQMEDRLFATFETESIIRQVRQCLRTGADVSRGVNYSDSL